MFFHENMKLPLKVGKLDAVNQSIKNYNLDPQRDKSSNILYSLSLAYLHTGQYSEAHNHLRKATALNPSVKFLANQLKALEGLLSKNKATLQDTSTTNKKILVVEDSATTRSVIVKKLRNVGYTIIEAGDGLEALSKLDSDKPDLILLDIILPKMDGYKVLSIIKDSNQEYADTPVIMLTSKDGMVNKLKGKMAGSTAYLTKPFETSKLINTIEKFI